MRRAHRARGNDKTPSHGLAIDAHGAGTVSDYRMYQLVRQPLPNDDREIELLLYDRGVALFAFTFG